VAEVGSVYESRMANGSKLIIAGIVAGATVLCGCDQPAGPQQASQASASSSAAPDQQAKAAEEKARKDADDKAADDKAADDKAWGDALRAGNVAAFTGYIQSFGSGGHVAEARQRLAALEEQARKDDDKAWSDASRAGTAAAISGYIQRFGAGAHVAEALQRLAALEQKARREAEEKARKDADDNAADGRAWTEASRAGTVPAITGYIQSFGSGAHVTEARHRLAALEQQAAEKAADDKAWAEALRAGAAAAFTDYIKNFSAGAHIAEARKRLAALEAKARQDAEAHRRAGAAIPVIDIKATCRTAAGVSGSLPTKETAEACIKSEQDARGQIAKQWVEFTATDRERCITPKVYLPSYVEWLTCLEMERDVRKTKRQPATPLR
jgi:hypothetical protein